MSIITNGVGVGGAYVGPTDGEFRHVIWGPNGQIAKVVGAPKVAADVVLPVGGINDGIFRALRTDRFGGLAIGQNNLQFTEAFEGTVQAASRILQSVTTFAPAQADATGLNLNNGNSLASGASAFIRSLRYFQKYQRAPLHGKVRARVAHQTGYQSEFGFGVPASTTTPPPIGAFWQVLSTGVVQPVLMWNGSPTNGAVVTMPANWQNNYYTWDIILDDDEAQFVVQDSETEEIIAERRIPLPKNQLRLWNATGLPFFVRGHNTAAMSAAATTIVANIDVMLLDMLMNRPWTDTLCFTGRGALVNPLTFAQTAQWGNSAVPANATLSNTAAGYTTLGGLFQFVAPAGAVTDFCLFGFQVPAPYSMVVKGIDIELYNSGAAVAGTPHTVQWFAGADQLAVSLAGTVMRKPLGMQSLPVGAVVGQPATRLPVDLTSEPLITHAGRFFTVGCRIPVGTATASQVLAGSVTVKGQFE